MNPIRTNRRNFLVYGAMASGAFLAAWGRGRFPEPLRAAEEAAPSGAPKLKIASVKTYLLRTTLKRPFGVSVSLPLDSTREVLLVKIESDSGLVGWGETIPIGGIRAAIDEVLAPQLIGKNPLEYRRLWRQMWGANFGNGLAVGGVDIALNDLRGKALNLPVAELFGGRLRDRIPAYASAMNYLEGLQPEDHYAEEAVEKKKLGFKAMKMRLGRYSVAREAKVAEAVRDAVGPDILLMADGNGAYTLESAVRMGNVLNRLGFEAFEEPLPQSPRYAGYEELRRKLPLSLAAGEVVDSRASAKDLIDRRAMDIIQPDISLCGGLGEALYIAETAALSGIRCIPHCWGSDILIAATTHLVSLLPDPHWGLPTDTPLLELDQSENPWRDGIAKGSFPLKDGLIDVPTGPGLGITVDEDFVRTYAVS
ncbi:mandelate racemase/muconate lactonizing enzyme family protein [Schlesneria sp. DSM 10557]|uniref:mandelate racemase/muconate lactonizing enzyme family protein n=1 Tax=Schlesneria sp. DSM 10557 TaxID=3044399 RepID=UPI00359FBECF